MTHRYPISAAIALGFVLLCLASPRPNHAQEPAIVAMPSSLTLSGRDASGLLVVQKAVQNSEFAGKQIHEGLTIESADPAIAVWKDGRVQAIADGKTELVVKTSDGAAVRVPVEVQGAGQAMRWQFDAHVQSVLTRAGCNSGACHGALAGKGGFRLSLRGYDSAADHFTITRQDRGRRIEPPILDSAYCSPNPQL